MTAKQSKHGQPWPVGAFFLTWKSTDGTRAIEYQGRVLAFDGRIVWGELYSWMDGGANGVHAIPFDADEIAFYLSDRDMRSASFEANRHRHRFIGTFEENEITWDGKPPRVHDWTSPLPDGFDSKAEVSP
jgi:hypothetical protein